jgi:hypothetical protein
VDAGIYADIMEHVESGLYSFSLAYWQLIHDAGCYAADALLAIRSVAGSQWEAPSKHNYTPFR